MGGSAYAESAPDVTYIFDSAHTLGGFLCHNDNADYVNCSDYSTVIIDVTDFSTYDVNKTFSLAPNGLTRTYILTDTTFSMLPSITRIWFDTGSGFTGSVTVTMTNSIPTPSGTLEITSNGTYDVTNYASVDVDVAQVYDCDDNFIVSSFKIIFINLVTGIIPTCAIIFVVWFFIDMITSFVYGRGR